MSGPSQPHADHFRDPVAPWRAPYEATELLAGALPSRWIRDRGDSVVNLSQGKTCLSCHQPAAKFDFVCEKGHGCAPIPFNDQAIKALQEADARCVKK